MIQGVQVWRGWELLMCLVLLAWRAHPRYPIVMAANRDEFIERPSAGATWWEDAPHVLAGRDLRDGGTWLGITTTGRFAVLTNYRDPALIQDNRPSRGQLVADFLRGYDGLEDFTRRLDATGGTYNPFNLIYGDLSRLSYFTNCADQTRLLRPGVYGLSNHLLDTPWPKVSKGKRALESALATLPDKAPLLDLLRDRDQAPDEQLPSTGISLEWERLLSSMFISFPGYGTRSSAILLLDAEGTGHFDEVSYSPEGEVADHRSFGLQLPTPS